MLKAVGFFYPGPPHVAYSSLAFHMIGNYISDVLKVPVYRYFLEENDIISFDRAPDPSKLNLIFVSIPFESLYPSVVEMLYRAGIQLFSKKRRQPIVIGGGPPLSANPLPLKEVLDVIVIGEAEPVLDDLVDLVDCNINKRICLEGLSDKEGLFLTEEPNLTKQVYVKDLNKVWHPVKLYLKGGIEPIWGRSYLLETSRGCGRGCRFCLEGFTFRPPRYRSFEVLRNLAIKGINVNRLTKISFYSLSFFDNPKAEDILAFAVNDLGLEISVPSMRVETLTPGRLRLIARGGQRSISIAPETGSCRIGRAFKKCIEKDLVINVIEEAIEAGIRSVKLYLIAAVPGENDKDLNETVRLVELASKKIRTLGGLLKVSVNPLIPKPYTPLQWLGFNRKFVEKRLRELVKALKKIGVDIRVYGAKQAQIQALLALGDERLSNIIVDWGVKGGGFNVINNLLRKRGLSIETYLDSKDPNYEPPWHKYIFNEFVDINLLRKEFKAFLKILSLDDTKWNS